LEKISTIRLSMDRLDTSMLILATELSEMEKILLLIKTFSVLEKAVY
jgi:hypothetical protein